MATTPHWLWPWTISLFEGFNYVKDTGVLICDLFVSGVIWCSIWGSYPVIFYMVSELFEGCICLWSKSEASIIASECHFLDLLFLTAFGPRGLIYYVRSICSNEELLSFHTKRFPVALATPFLKSRGIQSLFAVLVIHLYVYFGLFSSLFFINGSIPFISTYALCPATVRSRKIRKIKEWFFSCVCSFLPRLSVILKNQKHWGKYLVSGES